MCPKCLVLLTAVWVDRRSKVPVPWWHEDAKVPAVRRADEEERQNQRGQDPMAVQRHGMRRQPQPRLCTSKRTTCAPSSTGCSLPTGMGAQRRRTTGTTRPPRQIRHRHRLERIPHQHTMEKHRLARHTFWPWESLSSSMRKHTITPWKYTAQYCALKPRLGPTTRKKNSGASAITCSKTSWENQSPGRSRLTSMPL